MTRVGAIRKLYGAAGRTQKKKTNPDSEVSPFGTHIISALNRKVLQVVS